MKKYYKHIPNILTILRIFLIPVFLICSLKGKMLGALIVFVIAALTDLFDGIIARKFNYISNLGKILDPLADKLLVGFALILFVYLNLLSWWLAAIIIIREIVMTLYRSHLQRKNIYLPANIYGKIKTTIQMTVIIGSLLYKSLHFQTNWISITISILFYLTALFGWISFFIYLKHKKESRI